MIIIRKVKKKKIHLILLIISELSLNEESEKNNLKKDSILNNNSEGKMSNLKFTPIINPNIK